jgi:hypothetical protein
MTQMPMSAVGEGIAGEWARVTDEMPYFVFDANGTVRIQQQGRINFYFRDGGDPGFRGIIELEGNSRVKLEGKFTENEGERPTSFTKDVGVYARQP